MGSNNCVHVSCSFVGNFYLLTVENTVKWGILWEMLSKETYELATDVGPHIVAPGWVEPNYVSAFSFTTVVGFCTSITSPKSFSGIVRAKNELRAFYHA